MTRTLQICLMILTTALCGVCVLQWQREGRAAAREQALAGEIQALQADRVVQTEKLAAWEQEITRLNDALTAPAAAGKSLTELQGELTAVTRQLEQKTAALTQLSAAGETLRGQLQKALDERDALARRLNERTAEFNALAAKLRKRP
jgi:hypothetical protein